MGDQVRQRITNRLVRTAWNFFKNQYDSKRDRERFAAFLTSVVSGRSIHSQSLASLFRQAIEDEGPAGKLHQEVDYAIHLWPVPWSRWHDWLSAFFEDEPDWEQRLRRWIASFPDD
jgi:hypothetical protein